jgi:YhcH/YjgK/YiaL family protein
MSLDALSESHQYTAISGRFEKAFEFLRQVNKDTAPGRYEIDGEDIFAFVQQHLTKPIEERQYEAHRKYIDVQYIIRGREVIYWAPLPLLTNVTMPFSEEHDAALYSVIPEGMPYPLREGQFTILFPRDGHVPSCTWDQPAEVLKVVVKVKV